MGMVGASADLPQAGASGFGGGAAQQFQRVATRCEAHDGFIGRGEWKNSSKPL
jgi:hypothetical protein